MDKFVEQGHTPEGVIFSRPLGQLYNVLSVVLVVVSEVFEFRETNNRLRQIPIEILFVIPMEVSV